MSKKTLHKDDSVRQKLLDASVKVFAEKGFSQATTREISTLAGANVAAISYYWGNKEKLYKQVVKELIIERTKNYPLTAAMNESLSPEARLKKFIELFLRRLLGTGQSAWSSKIMVREMTHPTEAIKMVLSKLIKPTFEVLTSIIYAICGEAVPQDRVKQMAVSIISQCVFYFNVSNITDRLIKEELLPEFDLEQLVEHITKFSLSGLLHD